MSTIGTDSLRCRICYRCVRSCPVKAIRVQADRVQVVEERCIDCASCVAACPQEAMTVRNDVQQVRDALARGCRVVASVDPAAPAYWSVASFRPIREALQRLGFADAQESAVGAAMIADRLGHLVDGRKQPRPIITTACPAVVLLIQKYYPTLLPNLAPIVSPMIAHGRWLKASLGPDAVIVYVGPCVAKKVEITDEAVAGAVDVVLTLSELQEWLEDEGIALETSASRRAERCAPPAARLACMEGGLVKAAQLDTEGLTSRVLTTSGMRPCLHLLDSLVSSELEAELVELMLCEGGCLTGPSMQPVDGPFVNRQKLRAFAGNSLVLSVPPREQWPELGRTYASRALAEQPVSEEQIREVLRRMDKFTPEDELNCGACGYPTCRDKAIATVRGMAEVRMCIPHMRSQAESLANVVLAHTPNYVLVVDCNLLIVSMSPSTERAFGCRADTMRLRPLKTLLSPLEDFEQALEFQSPVVNSKVRYGRDLIVEQTIVPALADKMLVCIMRDITIEERRREELSHLVQETIARSQEVINRQMLVAHEIASLLGETTAESKIQLGRLMELVEGLGDA